MSDNRLSSSQLDQFWRDGYLIVRGLFSKDEIDPVAEIAVLDSERRKGTWTMKDSAGRASNLWLDTQVKDDAYGAIVRSARIVEPVTQILEGPVYSWHYKMMQKEPKVGGAWEWHQDYGYWYGDNCLFPNLVSCMVAVTRATRENGCLQVLKASHKLGRIEHGRVAGQAGADIKRVEAAMKVLELVHGELEPGDALYFHSNTLHCSAANNSDYPRWSFITCYNAMSNVPFDGKGHGKPLEIVPVDEAAVLQMARKQLESLKAARDNATVATATAGSAT